MKHGGFGYRRYPVRMAMRGLRHSYRRFGWGLYRPFRLWRPFVWYPFWWRPLFWLPWTIMMGGCMFLLYDSMAYKLYNDDVRQIEREMGKPVKELTEEELVAAMRRLGIQRLELTREDKEAIAESKGDQSRYCIYCGVNLFSEGLYCSRCGKKIKMK